MTDTLIPVYHDLKPSHPSTPAEIIEAQKAADAAWLAYDRAIDQWIELGRYDGDLLDQLRAEMNAADERLEEAKANHLADRHWSDDPQHWAGANSD